MAKRTKPPGPAPPNPLADFERTLAAALAVAEKNPDALAGMHEQQGNPRTLAPRVREVDDWVEKQIANSEAAANRWKAGVLRPKKDPIQAAKDAKGKWKDKMEEAIRDGAFEAGLDAVDEDAMIATLEATEPRVFSDGVRRRQAKITTKVGRLRPLVVALAETIDRLPQDTDAQREARLLAARRGMIEIGKKMKGRR